MADDDGLFMNFVSASTGGSSRTHQKQKVKGSWRERRRVEKRQRARVTPIVKPTKPVAPVIPVEAELPKSSSKPHSRPKSTNDRPRFDRDTKKRLDDNTFLTSLFTSNPEPLPENMQAGTATSASDATNAPLGDSTFSGLGLPEPIQAYLASNSILNPTRIQRAAIPQLIKGERDLMIVAQTGSGKTLAYLLPVVARLMQQPDLHRDSGVFAVILAPTRELAAQIFSVCDEMCRKACHWLVPGLVVGGEKKKSEKARLRKGVNFLIGTPGRMADHFGNTRALDLSQVRVVILDEGDRLVELGFEETLTQIMEKIESASRLNQYRYSKLPPRRINVLCSATLNNSTKRLRTLTLQSPVWVQSGEEGEESRSEEAPAQLQQKVMIVPAKLRLVALAASLRRLRRRKQKAVVFFSNTDSVDFHFKVFSRDNTVPNLFKLHGSLTQAERVATLTAFNKSPAPAVLLTTDVASRGLDTIVDCVIEYDPPVSIEDHLHRAGRTARAGRMGNATIMLLPSEQAYIEKLKALHTSLETSGYEPLISAEFGINRWQTEATTWQLGIERWLLNEEEELESARAAFKAHVRAYTTHPLSEREIFNFRSLHLGHLAKAFGLREVPSSSEKTSGTKQRKERPKSARSAMLDAAKRASEYSEFNVA